MNYIDAQVHKYFDSDIIISKATRFKATMTLNNSKNGISFSDIYYKLVYMLGDGESRKKIRELDDSIRKNLKDSIDSKIDKERLHLVSTHGHCGS